MATRKLEDKNIRKILKNGDSYAITIPIEIMNELKWKEKQKVIVKKIRGGFMVRDWKKQDWPLLKSGKLDIIKLENQQ